LRTVRFLTTAAATLLVVPAAVSARVTYFHTPSKKVYCAYVSSPTRDLRCDTKYRIAPLGTYRCHDGDWGQAIDMSPRSKAHGVCAGDTIIGTHGSTIPYGTTRHFGPFKCTSRTSGLTCTNAVGHGWLLSDTHQRKF
jgi:hypothetical protein